MSDGAETGNGNAGNAGNVVSLAEHKKKRRKKKKSLGVKGLIRGFDGVPKPTLGNVVTILQNEEAWEGVFSFDLHAGRVRKEKPLPAGPNDVPAENVEVTPFLEDADIDLVCLWIERKYKVDIGSKIVLRGIVAAARSSARDPIRDYLESLKWDGKKRLDTWLTDYVMVEGTPYTRAVGAAWMISGVARIYVPAAQVDHVLILEGEQRGGKSSALHALCPNVQWFLSTTVDIGNKDAFQVISGKWIVEFAELGSMSKGVESKVKAFITDRVDVYRQAYAHLVIDQKRRCIFAGSVNPGSGDGYLKDATGGGRWWPVYSHSSIDRRLDIGKIEQVRDQLWAEALVRYKKGEPWHLTDPTLIKAAEEEQANRRQVHPWEEKVQAYLLRPHIFDSGVSINDVLEAVCEVEIGRANPGHSQTVASILTALGWSYAKRSKAKGGTRKRLYLPTEKAAKPAELGRAVARVRGKGGPKKMTSDA